MEWLDRLWSPWRMRYVSEGGGRSDCIFCTHLEADDDASHILFRGEGVFVLLNAYPYNTGHVMVAPMRHVADLDELNQTERNGLMEVTSRATSAIKQAMGPDGFNVGMNLGAAGGAGIPGHLHVHVVPRWSGDTNFMTTIAGTKVLPEMLADTYARLQPFF